MTKGEKVSATLRSRNREFRLLVKTALWAHRRKQEKVLGLVLDEISRRVIRVAFKGSTGNYMIAVSEVLNYDSDMRKLPDLRKLKNWKHLRAYCYTLGQAAQEIGIKPTSVRDAIRKRRLPAYRMLNMPVVLRRDIRAYRAKLTRPGIGRLGESAGSQRSKQLRYIVN